MTMSCSGGHRRGCRINRRPLNQFFRGNANHSCLCVDILVHYRSCANRCTLANFHVLQDLCPGAHEHALSQFNSARYVDHWIECATAPDHSLMGDSARHVNQAERLKPNVHGGYGAGTDHDTLTDLHRSSLPFDTRVDKCRPLNVWESLFKFFRKLEPYRRVADPYGEGI